MGHPQAVGIGGAVGDGDGVVGVKVQRLGQAEGEQFTFPVEGVGHGGAHLQRLGHGVAVHDAGEGEVEAGLALGEGAAVGGTAVNAGAVLGVKGEGNGRFVSAQGWR